MLHRGVTARGSKEYVAVWSTLDDASLASIRWAVTSIRPST